MKQSPIMCGAEFVGFIPYNVPSLKNSKTIVTRGKRPMLIPSKRHSEYKKNTAPFYSERKAMFLHLSNKRPKPLFIGLYFLRDSRHRFDYSNAIQTIEDIIVEQGWIEDDNADCLVPVPLGFSYNKETPGVFIWLLAENAVGLEPHELQMYSQAPFSATP